MTDIWPNFTTKELSCRHCGEWGCIHEAVDRLQALRIAVQRPLVVNSAYRCLAHNKAIGGAPDSFHVKGMAFDISLRGHDKYELYEKAKEAGFTGFGFYETFLHMDTGPARTWGSWDD